LDTTHRGSGMKETMAGVTQSRHLSILNDNGRRTDELPENRIRSQASQDQECAGTIWSKCCVQGSRGGIELMVKADRSPAPGVVDDT
jgi:hypothetical protein